MFWLECTRPPKSKFGPAKKLRSFSEKMPNWNTGTATVCTSRRMRDSAFPPPPTVDLAVTVIVYGVTSPRRPWKGPLWTSAVTVACGAMV